ncbi:rho GTPase-activating protein 27 isoform X2 [Denticeps clupeoides]|uniref:rho GTPase-activating protein 27 isoform X2 n=1 Tax=Denticeps clupeoides TaxID=299321 RepID=UPI0010A4B1B1|nr:rho GTPase-activating protein 27-like isoform X2 [Denticeps clupeoides]
MSSGELVQVLFEYNYTTKDGQQVTIKPNECYILVARTNDHWWHVRRDPETKAFYIPARYVKELGSGIRTVSLDPPSEFTSLEMAKDNAGQPEGQDVTLFPTQGYNTENVYDNVDMSGSLEFTGFPLPPEWDEEDHTRTLHPGSPVTETYSVVTKPAAGPANSQKPHLFKQGNDEGPPLTIKQNLMDLLDDWIYEPIPGLNSYMPELPCPHPEDASTLQHPAGEPPAKEQAEDDNPVYVNIGAFRRSISKSPAAPPSEPSQQDTGGWELHTEPKSGQDFYYHPATGRTTWTHPPMEAQGSVEEPLSSPPYIASPPLTSSPPAWRTSDWEKLLDENTGMPYFYNHASGESSWEPPEGVANSPRSKGTSLDEPPPLPEEDYPAEEDFSSRISPPGQSDYSLGHITRAVIPRATLDRSTPPGWNLTIDQEGMWIFTSEHTHEQWIKSLDDRGQTYYYLRDGSRSQWNLPEVNSAELCSERNGSSTENNGVEVLKNWRHSMGPVQEDKSQSFQRGNFSDYGSDVSNSPEMQPHTLTLEKAGILNKTKVSENGKKVRKNWAQSWTVLHGGILTFHKDPRSTATGSSSRSNQIVPEFTVDLRGAVIGWAAKEKSSKKNVVELKSRNGADFLMQYDTESIIQDWYTVIMDTIKQLEPEQQQQQQQQQPEEEEEINEKPEKDDRLLNLGEKKRVSVSVTQLSSSTSDAEQKKVRSKLKKFLLKRPTLQSVKEKGYIKENVFGCHLASLCAQEHSNVPSFVEKCIQTVEKRGLGIDGIYRVSGNLATIQKLRFKADHEDLDLEEGHWDIHVITGALKLFFRELQEPLFPFSRFNNFIAGIKIPNPEKRLGYMTELVQSLPTANIKTMEALFKHLRKVIEHGEENRMTVQNIAIVFGPTLLRPEVESANIAMYMVCQNQIVEFVLNEFNNLF